MWQRDRRGYTRHEAGSQRRSRVGPAARGLGMEERRRTGIIGVVEDATEEVMYARRACFLAPYLCRTHGQFDRADV